MRCAANCRNRLEGLCNHELCDLNRIVDGGKGLRQATGVRAQRRDGEHHRPIFRLTAESGEINGFLINELRQARLRGLLQKGGNRGRSAVGQAGQPGKLPESVSIRQLLNGRNAQSLLIRAECRAQDEIRRSRVQRRDSIVPRWAAMAVPWETSA